MFCKTVTLCSILGVGGGGDLEGVLAFSLQLVDGFSHEIEQVCKVDFLVVWFMSICFSATIPSRPYFIDLP